MWNECFFDHKVASSKLCSSRYISRPSRRVTYAAVWQRYTCISCTARSVRRNRTRGSFFFLSPIAFARASASRRRRGVKVPGHVANQRRSLCGTKKMTVTRLTTHGDTTVLTLRVRTHNIRVLAVDRRCLRLHTSSVVTVQTRRPCDCVYAIRLRRTYVSPHTGVHLKWRYLETCIGRASRGSGYRGNLFASDHFPSLSSSSENANPRDFLFCLWTRKHWLKIKHDSSLARLREPSSYIIAMQAISDASDFRSKPISLGPRKVARSL